MTETADFILRLKDETSGPAKNAKRGVEQLAAALRGAASDARTTERAWQRAVSARRVLTPSPPRIDRGLSVDFHRRALERGSAVSFARRQAQIQHAGGLGRIAQIEGTSAGGAAAMAGTFGGAAGAVLGLTAGAAVAAAAGVALLASRFASATASALDFGQRSKLAFGTLLGDASEGAVQFGIVRREAQRLGLDVNETVDSFRKLLAAQFNTSEAMQITRATADLQALGSSAMQVSKAVLAITQIKMKGVLQGEELTGQLAEAGVSAELVYSQLEKQLGKTRQEILKMQAARKISAEMAMPAILEAIKKKANEKELGDTALKFANSKISGMLAQVRAQVQNSFITLGEQLEPAATKMAQLAFRTFEKLSSSPAFTRFSGSLVRGFEGAVAWLERNWPTIERLVIGGVETMMNAVSSAIDFTREHWDDIQSAMKGAAAVAVVLGGAFALAAASVLTMTAPLIAVGAAVAYVTGKLIEGSAELGRWLRIAGAAASLVPGFSGAGAALTAAGALADRGGTVQSTEDQIRSESRARVAGTAVAGQAGRILGSNSGATTDNSRNVGSINIPMTFSALDPEDLSAVESKMETVATRAIRKALSDA